MSSFHDEHEDAAREEEEFLSAPGSWNRPLLLAALGLALMLGGYAATNYVPASAHQADAARRLEELRLLAQQRKEAGVDDGLPERLKQAAPPLRDPPYQMAGRLAIYGGLFLFVLAAVIMYRSPESSKKEDEAPSSRDP
jgi:hypothetical protein